MTAADFYAALTAGREPVPAYTLHTVTRAELALLRGWRVAWSYRLDKDETAAAAVACYARAHRPVTGDVYVSEEVVWIL